MGMILLGIAIALLDFPLELAGGRLLDLTPDILGYILVILGLRKIGAYSRKFAGAYRICVFTAIASGAVLGVNLLVGQYNMSMTIILIGILEMFLQVALLVLVASGLKDIEEDYMLNLYSKWLKIVALCIAPGIILGYAGLVVPGLEAVGSLIVDISSFAYLILFYFAWETFKTWKAEEE